MLRTLPIWVGSLGTLLLVINRTISFNPTPEQTRSDALGLMMGAVLVLVGVIARDIQPVPAPVITIQAPQGTELGSVAADLAPEVTWLAQTLIDHTAAVSVLIWDQGTLLWRSGYLGTQPFALGPIATRVLKTQKSIYLVDLNLLPGREEFNYLPPGIQAVVCQPLGTTGILILGANQIRSFRPDDLKWIARLTERLYQRLNSDRRDP